MHVGRKLLRFSTRLMHKRLEKSLRWAKHTNGWLEGRRSTLLRIKLFSVNSCLVQVICLVRQCDEWILIYHHCQLSKEKEKKKKSEA